MSGSPSLLSQDAIFLGGYRIVGTLLLVSEMEQGKLCA